MSRSERAIVDLRIGSEFPRVPRGQEKLDMLDQPAANSLSPEGSVDPNALEKGTGCELQPLAYARNATSAKPTADPSGVSAIKPHALPFPRIESILVLLRCGIDEAVHRPRPPGSTRSTRALSNRTCRDISEKQAEPFLGARDKFGARNIRGAGCGPLEQRFVPHLLLVASDRRPPPPEVGKCSSNDTREACIAPRRSMSRSSAITVNPALCGGR
jgi:hypothetical protein